ncbi:MAG: hypothetical protein WCB99_14445 [Candidatus Cybelea sp.]
MIRRWRARFLFLWWQMVWQCRRPWYLNYSAERGAVTRVVSDGVVSYFPDEWIHVWLAPMFRSGR